MRQLPILKSVQNILENAGVNSNSHIIVAVSGGPDSVCLLHALWCISHKIHFNLSVAHFNHMLRGKDAEQDAKFVEILSKQLGLQFFLGKADVGAAKKQLKLTTQETARNLRYNYLFDLKKRQNADFIATAHNMDDQAELILIRILRGCSTTGLRGMEAVSKTGIIHPLIQVSRKQILNYLNSNSLSFMTDHSNLKTYYLRNRIRLELIPKLEAEYNPNLKRTLTRMASFIQEDEKFLDQLASKALEEVIETQQDTINMDIKKVNDLESAIRRRVYIKAMSLADIPVSKVTTRHLEALDNLINSNRESTNITLPGDNIAKIHNNKIFFKRKGVNLPIYLSEKTNKIIIKDTGSYSSSWFNGTIIIEQELLTKPSNNRNASIPKILYIDPNTLKPPIYIRKRCPGDSFQPFGYKNKRRLKGFLAGRKIDMTIRHNIPIIEDQNGIVAIVGVEISHKNRITINSKSAWKIIWDIGKDIL